MTKSATDTQTIIAADLKVGDVYRVPGFDNEHERRTALAIRPEVSYFTRKPLVEVTSKAWRTGFEASMLLDPASEVELIGHEVDPTDGDDSREQAATWGR